MTTKTTYKIIAPLRSSFVFSIEAEKGLTHNEICNLVSNEDLSGCDPVIEWSEVKDSWYNEWNACCQSERSFAENPTYLDPWEATCIEDEEGNEVPLLRENS